MATLHKRKLVSGRVVWEITHGTGPDRRRFIAGNTREEAQQVLQQFERQVALHGSAPTDDSVEAILNAYLSYLQSNRRHGTVRRYVRVLQTFQQNFLRAHHPEVDRLRQIKPLHIEEFKRCRAEGRLHATGDEAAERRDAELRLEIARGVRAEAHRDNARFGWLGRKRFRSAVTSRTVNYELRVLRTFFHWAVRHNYLFVNPATGVESFRVPKPALPKFLTSDQLQRLFAACSEQERRLFMTILLTGMRKGEVEHLTWTDINFDLNVIFIQAKPEFNWQPKTDERVIPIAPVLREILLAHHAVRRTDLLVFPNKEGNLDTHILGKLKKISRRAAVPTATVHSLRHSFGAHLRMAGVSLADIADLLGHKDLATTQIYAKVHQEHLRSVIGRLSPFVESFDAAPRPTPVRSIEPATVVRGLLKD